MPRINPFSPTLPVSSDMFAGRRAEIGRIVTALRQTQADKPVHFLVLGERGIGKSSFLSYVDDLAAGRTKIENDSFSFLVVHTDINRSVGTADLAKKIHLGLEHALGRSEKAREFLTQAWGFLERIQFGGFSVGKGDRPTILDDPSIEQFTYSLTETVARIVDGTAALTSRFDGLVILIDECDRASEQLDLGSFAKNLLERLKRQHCHRLVLGIAGLPEVRDRLEAGHRSAPRLFQPVELSRLSQQEAAEALDRGIKAAREQNHADIQVADKATTRILELAEGHPHLLQQIAYSAFDADLDDYVDETDVDAGLLDQNGALAIIGSIYYKPKFIDPELGECDRAVLRSLAADHSGWTTRDHVLSRVSADKDQVLGSLASLVERGLIIRDPRGAARFEFAEKMFGLWVQHCLGTI